MHDLIECSLEFCMPVVEAMIFASPQPLSLTRIEQLFQRSGYFVDRAVLKSCIESLQQACDARAIELMEVASGFEYRVKTAFSPWLVHMTEERPQRYSRALLETLALIVYRQPITRAEIEEVRGVAVSSTILRTLLEREWIKEVGYKDVPGRPMLFATTRLFLDYFGLKNLCDLPPLEDFTHLDDVGTQLEKMLHETESTTTE